MDRNSLIFSGNGNIDFSQEVASHSNTKLSPCEVKRFANGEIGIVDSVFVRKIVILYNLLRVLKIILQMII